MTNESPIGEIVEASLVEFTAEIPPDHLHTVPAFGSFVRWEEKGEAVYGVVAASGTVSVEPNRRAVAFWQTEEELRKTQPQIFELLSTRFTALIVGCRNEGVVQLRLPAAPPRVHGFVYACGEPEVRQLSADAALLRPLLEAPLAQRDELVAAVLRRGAAARPDYQQFLIAAGKQLALLLRDDYPRLQAIIRKLTVS